MKTDAKKDVALVKLLKTAGPVTEHCSCDAREKSKCRILQTILQTEDDQQNSQYSSQMFLMGRLRQQQSKISSCYVHQGVISRLPP